MGIRKTSTEVVAARVLGNDATVIRAVAHLESVSVSQAIRDLLVPAARTPTPRPRSRQRPTMTLPPNSAPDLFRTVPVNPFDRAELYRRVGWAGTLPLPHSQKSPPPSGFTGAEGRWPENQDLEEWRARKGPYNLAVRFPPIVLGLDVDAYGDKPGAITLRRLEADNGRLPATWTSTSRADGVSGIRLYRVPHGIESWPTEAGPGIEIIRHGHRYAVVWPSEHPDGRMYVWLGPDGTEAEGEIPSLGDLPELPARWLKALTGVSENGRRDPGHARPGSRAERRESEHRARKWIRGLATGDPCTYVGKLAAEGLASARRENGTAYDHVRDDVLALLQAGEKGHSGVPNVLAMVRAEYVATVRADRAGDAIAGGEFDRLELGGVARILANPSDGEPGCDCPEPVPPGGAGEAIPKATGSAKSKATRAVDLAKKSGARFWHDPNGQPYLDTFGEDRIRRTLPLRSRAARTWLSGLLYQEEKQALGGQSATDAIDVLSAIAQFEGEELEAFTRLAKGSDGEIYLDLGDESWRAVRVTAEGWDVVPEPPVRFRRPRGLRALPIPQRGGSLEPLRTVLNVSTDRDWQLLVAWVVGALRPDGPYPILPLAGEQGSAKTTATRILRHMIDPNEVPVRTLPREERDIIIAAQNGLIIGIDNVSYLRPWLSDALCRMSTGGGFSTRELYTTGEEAIFAACRPVILTGIEDVVVRGDLADRAIPVELPRIPDKQRRTEVDLWATVDRIRPGVLGALLDAVATGLRREGTLILQCPPRMADFALWVCACEPGLPWKQGEFLHAYADVRQDLVSVAIEADPIATAVQALMEKQKGSWAGRATELLKALNKLRDDDKWPPKGWPETSQELGGRLRRVAPLLRKSGLSIEKKKSGDRIVTISRLDDEAAQKPPDSKPLQESDLDDTGDLSPTRTSGVEGAGKGAQQTLFATKTPPQEEAPWITI